MGMTHGEPDTYPRTADVMGFCADARRDRGRRSGRHRAARLGRPHQSQACAAEIHHRGSRARCVPRRGREARRRDARSRRSRSPSPRPATATAGPRARTARRISRSMSPNGRIQDEAGGAAMLTGLRKIAEIHKGDMRLTANQNVIIANVAPEERAAIEAIVDAVSAGAAGLRPAAQFDGLRRAADLRARARRERALSARPDHCARRAARRVRPLPTTTSSSA